MRVERYLADRQLFDPALIAEARRIASDAGTDRDSADRFIAAAVDAFALSREPIDRAWYDELAHVSAVAADIAGVRTTHINHLTPRVLDIDELYVRMSRRGIEMIDAIQGPRDATGPPCCCGRRLFARFPNRDVSATMMGRYPRARCACASGGRIARRRVDRRGQTTLRPGDG